MRRLNICIILALLNYDAVVMRLVVRRLGYLVYARQAVDDAKHNDSISMRIIGDLNCHGVEQHLIKTVGQQWFRQLAEKVFQRACHIPRTVTLLTSRRLISSDMTKNLLPYAT